jgi:hypothetical protein
MQHDSHPRSLSDLFHGPQPEGRALLWAKQVRQAPSSLKSEWMATEERSTSSWLEFACCVMLFAAHMSAAAFALKSLGKVLVT